MPAHSPPALLLMGLDFLFHYIFANAPSKRLLSHHIIYRTAGSGFTLPQLLIFL